MDKDQIAALVEAQLRDQADSFQLPVPVLVLKPGIRAEDENWYVPVQPAGTLARTSSYYEMLAEIETTLLEQHRISVTLIPTLPEQSSAA